MAALSQDFLEAMDCEYGTGTVRMGNSLLGSVTRNIPAGTDASDVMVNAALNPKPQALTPNP